MFLHATNLKTQPRVPLQLYIPNTQVEENCAIPVNLLALNVSAEYSNKKFGSLRFTLIPDEHSSYFNVNPSNGSVHLVKSPDREVTAVLRARIRVDRLSKRGKSVQMIYPVQSDAFADLGTYLQDSIRG